MKMKVQRMVLYFKVDKNNKIWLLLCQFLKTRAAMKLSNTGMKMKKQPAYEDSAEITNRIDADVNLDQLHMRPMNIELTYQC